jgi:hypothetical protein
MAAIETRPSARVGAWTHPKDAQAVKQLFGASSVVRDINDGTEDEAVGGRPCVGMESADALWRAEATTDQAYPMGDFRQKDTARTRKFDALVGAMPLQRKQELALSEQLPSERPATEHESWEISREVVMDRSNKESATALRRDAGAWTDAEGYQQLREPPAFRDGYNNTLRVLPPQEPHLHNGTYSLKERTHGGSAPALGPALHPQLPHATHRPERALGATHARAQPTQVAAARAMDLVHRAVAQRADVAQAVGAYFMRGISTGLVGIKSRDLDTPASAVRHETTGDALLGAGAHADVEHGRTEADPSLDGARAQGEIQLLLRALAELEQPPADFVSDASLTEAAVRRQEVLSHALGRAFVDIGLTLPAGSQEDPLRNDSVAMQMGLRVMQSGVEQAAAPAPSVDPAFRREVATALGRALLHLRAAAGVEASRGGAPSVDAARKERSLRASVGRLTLQLLESTAQRAGRSLVSDPKRREVLSNMLGACVMQMEAAASMRERASDRSKAEPAALARGTAPTGAVVASAKKPQVLRLNRPSETLNVRPVVGGKAAAPPSVPRVLPLRRDSRGSELARY